jgi:uncharacterized protein (TIGR00369 family)
VRADATGFRGQYAPPGGPTFQPALIGMDIAQSIAAGGTDSNRPSLVLPMTKIDGPSLDTLASQRAPQIAQRATARGRALRDAAHPHCIACSPEGKTGLGLDFHEVGDGSVRATFDCAAVFEGYPGYLHGGIISTILDSAMTNCLFAQGHQAVTAELSVKFHAPVALQRVALAEAHATRNLFPLFVMEASLSQDGQTKATAMAKFIVPRGL